MTKMKGIKVELQGEYKNFEQIASFDITDYPPISSTIPKPEVDEFTETLKLLSNPHPHIIDFGGSQGYYGTLIKDRTYNVIETPKMCKKFGSENNAHYYTEITNINSNIDLFVSNGGLQYHPSPLSVLKYVKLLNPEFILLQRMWTSTRERSYITLQIFPPHKIPVWALLTFDIINILKPEYKLVYEKLSQSMPTLQKVELKSLLFKRII